jgi:hypothetical protein
MGHQASFETGPMTKGHCSLNFGLCSVSRVHAVQHARETSAAHICVRVIRLDATPSCVWATAGQKRLRPYAKIACPSNRNPNYDVQNRPATSLRRPLIELSRARIAFKVRWSIQICSALPGAGRLNRLVPDLFTVWATTMVDSRFPNRVGGEKDA